MEKGKGIKMGARALLGHPKIEESIIKKGGKALLLSVFPSSNKGRDRLK